MSTNLPTAQRPREIEYFHVSQRSDLTAIIGGSTQRRERTGSRGGVMVALPAMTAEDALPWQRRLKVSADTVVLELPQPGITIGSPGSPLVNGGSQTGTSLIIDGGAAGYTFKEGQLVAFSVSSLIYCYEVAADVTLNGSGAGTLTFSQPIRRSPADNAALIINPAKIEGFVELEGGALAVSVDRIMAGCSFKIVERE